MSKELDTFDKWWMMQSKIPYRDKKEIAQSAWNQSRTATLDAMQAEIDEIEKSEIWAQMGIPAECHGVYIEKFDEAIDNLRGKSDE